MQASTRAFTRVRFLRGKTRSSGTMGRIPGGSAAADSEAASIQMAGESQYLQCRATHLRISNDFKSASLRYTTSRRWQKPHSIKSRAKASSDFWDIDFPAPH